MPCEATVSAASLPAWTAMFLSPFGRTSCSERFTPPSNFWDQSGHRAAQSKSPGSARRWIQPELKGAESKVVAAQLEPKWAQRPTACLPNSCSWCREELYVRCVRGMPSDFRFSCAWNDSIEPKFQRSSRGRSLTRGHAFRPTRPAVRHLRPQKCG